MSYNVDQIVNQAISNGGHAYATSDDQPVKVLANAVLELARAIQTLSQEVDQLKGQERRR